MYLADFCGFFCQKVISKCKKVPRKVLRTLQLLSVFIIIITRHHYYVSLYESTFFQAKFC